METEENFLPAPYMALTKYLERKKKKEMSNIS